MEVNIKPERSGNDNRKSNPFPGLRPFAAGESGLFFGRAEESRAVLRKLIGNRFVTVLGASGTGKSSLLSCGLLQALNDIEQSEFSFSSIILFRPGNDPFASLGSAMATQIKGQENISPERILIDMHLDPDGITTTLRKHLAKNNEKVLLVIDQFEELFRFRASGAGDDKRVRAPEFVDKIVKAVNNEDSNIFAAISMRSDYIGECSHYKGLTQLINSSSFLVPHMSRENYRQVIEGPVKYAGASIDPGLVETILNDIGDRNDQLPVLQHAMMRTWNHWQELNDPSRPVNQADYDSAGTLSESMSRHADEAFEELDRRGKEICEKLFRAITEKGPDNKGMRRPLTISAIKSIIQCSDEELTGVIGKFRMPRRSFIMPGHEIPLCDDTVIDISHESLIRLWDRLREWVENEAASVQTYMRLAEASSMFQQGRTSLLRSPELQLALNWRNSQNPTLAWAQRYDPAFERAMVYLRTSEREYVLEEDRKARLQKRKIRRTRITAAALGTAAIIAGAFMIFAIMKRIAADRAVETATQKSKQEALQRHIADSLSRIAVDQKNRADSSAFLAAMREREAVEQKSMAFRQREAAIANATLAEAKILTVEAIADSASRAGTEARQNMEIAIAGRNEELRKRMIAIGKSMSVKSLQLQGQKDLQTLLAYQAYIFNKKNGGIENDADIYGGLYNVARQYGHMDYKTFTHEGIKSIAFVPGKKEFYTSGNDYQVRKWTLEGSNPTFEVIYSGTEIIEVLAISPDASWLACGSEKDAIRMIPLNGKDLQYSLEGHSGRIRSLIFSYDGKYLYSASRDGKVLRWDIASRTSADVTSGQGTITSVDISPDGQYLAGLNPEGNVILWNPESVSGNTKLPTGLREIRAIRFRPDENTLAIGDVNGNVELWNIDAMKKISEVKAHSAGVTDIEFNPVLKQMATAGMDYTMKIFNNPADLTEPPVTFTDSEKFVVVIQFSPDGQLIVSGSFEGSNNITSRPAHVDILARDACALVSRNMTQEEWNVYVARDLPLEKTCENRDYNIKVRVVK